MGMQPPDMKLKSARVVGVSLGHHAEDRARDRLRVVEMVDGHAEVGRESDVEAAFGMGRRREGILLGSQCARNRNGRRW